MTEQGLPTGGQTHSGPQRPRLKLKKRDPVEAARLEAERVANLKNNPFGEAKPRETVLARRTGKDEKAIVAEDAQGYQVRLTAEQHAEKKALLEELDELRTRFRTEDMDDEAAAKLKDDIASKQHELDTLVEAFEGLLASGARASDPAKLGETRRVGGGVPDEMGRAGFPRGGTFGPAFGARRAHGAGDVSERHGTAYERPRRGNRGEFDPGSYQDRGPAVDMYVGDGGGMGGSAFGSYTKRGGVSGAAFRDSFAEGGHGSDARLAGAAFGGGYEERGYVRGRGDAGEGFAGRAAFSSKYSMGAADANVDYRSPFTDR